MRDFLNYSGMSVQAEIGEADLARPPFPAGIRGNAAQVDFSLMSSQPCNVFAIAKVGVPNLIMPNTLDIKLSNFESFENYISVSDLFFPEAATSQQTLVVLRPLIVKNGLNEFVLQILRNNEFTILRRTKRMLTLAEATYLYRQEAIPPSNNKLYLNLMLEGPCELLVLSKLGAVADAHTLFNGANPFGRRRVN